VEGSPGCGGILLQGAPPSSRARQMRKVVSHDRNISQGFLMPRNEPRRRGRPGEGHSHGCYTREPTRSSWDAADRAQVPWEARGRAFPRLLHPGARPIKLGCRCTTRSPADHLPAIHPYWEYPVNPICRIRQRMRKILTP